MNSSRTSKAPRGPSRGGISKSRSTTPRLDKDGDLDMGSSIGGGRGRGSGRGSRGHTVRASAASQPVTPLRSRAGRNGIAPERLHQALLNGDKLQARITSARKGEGLKDIKVTGFRDSKAANNQDGGLKTFISWLERKASGHGDPIRITKSRDKKDHVLISVKSEWEDKFTRLNGFEFAGAKIGVEPIKEGEDVMQDASTNGTQPTYTGDLKIALTNVLKKRYDATNKILNLSALGQDPDLQQLISLGSEQTFKKLFPALMKMADSVFETSTKKEEMVSGITLSSNALEDLELVTTLAPTFPDLKNLDMSNNNLKTMDALKRWQWKLRKLQHIILSGNAVDQLPETRSTLLKWFPKLTHINTDQVRSAEEVAKKINPIPVQPPSFRDQEQIAAKFLTAFFPMFDDNREGALQMFYDQQTTFSLSVNSSAPRMQQADPPHWDPYIKKSRNLLKISYLTARTTRLIIGAEAIKQEWSQLPKTKHPSLTIEGEKWLVECHPLPGLPDPSNSVQGGVGGLIIMAHSHWDEIDVSTNQPKQSISFDRTFVLGPGGTAGIRVISDIICLRAFGGADAWKAMPLEATVQAAAQPPPEAGQAPLSTTPQLPETPPGFGQPAPGKAEEQLRQEVMIAEISVKTRLKLDLAKQCLEMNGWDMIRAVQNFEDLKTNGQIPPESYW